MCRSRSPGVLAAWRCRTHPASGQVLDAQYVEKFAQRVGELFPGCPVDEQRAIAEHACRKYSGRVGRSAAAKELEAGAIELAVRAHVRHTHTRYDEILSQGVARGDARGLVSDLVAKRLEDWSTREPDT